MKKNMIWIWLLVLLAALIWGASALYDNLGQQYQMDQLATQAPPVDAVATEPATRQTELPQETETDATEPETVTSPLPVKMTLISH